MTMGVRMMQIVGSEHGFKATSLISSKDAEDAGDFSLVGSSGTVDSGNRSLSIC
jgi:hypothetical protein